MLKISRKSKENKQKAQL